MTKGKIRDALASVPGFKPVKTVRHKLLVISVHVLLRGLFLILPLFIYRIRIHDVSFFYREIINKSFLIRFAMAETRPVITKFAADNTVLSVGLINARRRLDVIYPGRHMPDVIDNDHLYIVNLKIELDHES